LPTSRRPREDRGSTPTAWRPDRAGMGDGHGRSFTDNNLQKSRGATGPPAPLLFRLVYFFAMTGSSRS
jgi:hypothetical protein